ALDADEAAATFDVPSPERLTAMPREHVVDLLLTGGMWPFLRALPFMDLADPDITPPVIIVRVGDDEPFAPHPAIYLDGRREHFELGIEALKRLCDQVAIHLTGKAAMPTWLFEQKAAVHFTGPYATGNPAVQLYRTKTGPQQNRAWFIDGQDVALLGDFLRSGRYPLGRIVSVGGSLARHPGHVATRAGAPLQLVAGGTADRNPAARLIVGGVFTGFTGDVDGFMGFYQNALNLIDEGNREEFLGFIRPGIDKPSRSTAFLSALRRDPFPMDCGQHGEIRACINCGYCSAVCPVDILPQFTMKCLVADEVEEALAHGLLDCSECGLCTFVCPSKIALREALMAGKAQYYREIS
ncbi:MAG TPA: 4Fe-4S dicluster domain-containing protein, partial [Desulfosarcina sp.]|nr:4Fe-4S dicluster domain-containing protein [Desulfosarcina sp.]